MDNTWRHNMKNLFKVWSLAIALAFGAMQAFGQFTWTKDARNPVFSGIKGTWSANVFTPCVLFNADSARYEMWFGATPGPQSDPTWRPYSVGFAVSNDGINWSMYPSPVLSPDPGKWDSFTTDAPQVLRENGQYKMWYSSYKGGTSPAYFGYATSPDGIHWTKYSGNPILGPGTAAWEAAGPFSCCVIPKQGGYRIWYDGYSLSLTTWKIGYAESSDGVNWVRDTVNDPVLGVGSTGQWDAAGVGEPRVVGIGSSFYMWYVGSEGGNGTSTGLAVSMDGRTNWTKYPSNPVLVPGAAGTWDAERTWVGTVMRVRDTLHVWYDGWRTPYTSYQYRIGHATSPYGLWVRLVAPQDNADLTSNSFRLSWNHTAVPAVGYHLQLATDSLFAQLMINDTTLTDTSYAAGGIATGNYYWRVCARDANGWGLFSDIRRLSVLTGITADRDIPRQYALQQNYPNPFNPTTGIRYQVSGVSEVKLAVYDLLGREVAVLVNERKPAGIYEVKFDGTGFASGVYLYKLTAGTYVQTRRMILLK
jgi:predicted GH43/DUF377 family glycosyl hydrolase